MCALVLLLSLALPGDGGFAWINAPRLHNPTQDAVVVAAVPERDAEIQAFWAGRKTAVQVVRAGDLCTLVLDGLAPGRRTSARISARALGEESWEAHESLDLRPLPAHHEPVRFAIAADTHVWALFTKEHGGSFGDSSPFALFEQARDNMLADAGLDFGVVFGDFAMTQCGGCVAYDAPFGSASEGPVADLDDALVRYRMAWGDAMLGPLAAKLPMVTLNGDHEGEIPWAQPVVVGSSVGAREQTLPAPGQGYLPGPPGTLAYAFEAGPVLVVAVDLHSQSERNPTAPEHWQLGEAQHEWMAEVLGASRRPWKIVMAEHLVGGVSDPHKEHWKGRGSITATDDGTPEGTFLGEQALLHQTLVSTGADLFITGHDHVVSWAEKDGVAYLIAGRAGGVGNSWADRPWYREAMDFDGDGVPVYETEGLGTREPGHVEISADLASLRVRYLRASLQESLNGDVLLDQELTR
jgi:hypothetical protein